MFPAHSNCFIATASSLHQQLIQRYIHVVAHKVCHADETTPCGNIGGHAAGAFKFRPVIMAFNAAFSSPEIIIGMSPTGNKYQDISVLAHDIYAAAYLMLFCVLCFPFFESDAEDMGDALADIQIKQQEWVRKSSLV